MEIAPYMHTHEDTTSTSAQHIEHRRGDCEEEEAAASREKERKQSQEGDGSQTKTRVSRLASPRQTPIQQEPGIHPEPHRVPRCILEDGSKEEVSRIASPDSRDPDFAPAPTPAPTPDNETSIINNTTAQQQQTNSYTHTNTTHENTPYI